MLVLAQGHTWFWMIFTTVLAVVLTSFFYFRAFGSLERKHFLILLALRIVAVCIVILLLFRPMLQFTKEESQRKSIVFAVDTSQSMSISDATGDAGMDSDEGTVATANRIDQVRGKVLSWGERLKDDFDLHLVEFAEDVQNYNDFRKVASSKADGKTTSIYAGFIGCVRVNDSTGRPIPRSDIEAVFLFSDGQHNTARKPDEEAVKLGIPVYSIGVGSGLKSSAGFKDVQVTDVRCPERLMLNNLARLTATVEAIGLPGRVVRVILEEDASQATEPSGRRTSGDGPNPETSTAPGGVRIIEEKELTLNDGEGPQEIMFEFRPEKLGRHTYTVRIPKLDDEAIRENNDRQTSSMVIEPGIRVLYLEGVLRPENGAIVERFLSKDPDIEFCSLVQTRPNNFLKRTNIEGLSLNSIPSDQESVDMFDVFIIGDLDSSYLQPDVQEMILNRVRNGGGLVMLGGYRSLGPGGYAGTPIGKELPVVLGDREIGQYMEPFLPKLTPDGRNSHIFANIENFFPSQAGPAAIEGLPELDGCTKVLASGPGATVLATCPGVMLADNREMPVLAYQPCGEGRTLVFTADTTRKWQQGPKALNMETPFMQFWGQLVRFLAHREGPVSKEAGCSAAIDKAYYDPEEPVTITATVRNAEGEGTERAKVTAKIIQENGKEEEVSLEAIQGNRGKYTGFYTPKLTGKHEVKVVAELEGGSYPAPEKMIFDVGRPNMEFDRLDLNEAMMMKIANATGGRYAHISVADHLVEQLNRAITKKKIIETINFAPPLPLWILFVVLLSAEWLARKRFHLR